MLEISNEVFAFLRSAGYNIIVFELGSKAGIYGVAAVLGIVLGDFLLNVSGSVEIAYKSHCIVNSALSISKSLENGFSIVQNSEYMVLDVSVYQNRALLENYLQHKVTIQDIPRASDLRKI